MSVDGGTVSAVAVGVFGLVGAVTAAVLNYRGAQRATQQDEVAAVLASYDELVRNLREEATRKQTEIDRVARVTREELEHERMKARAEIDAHIERCNAEVDRAQRRYDDARAETAAVLADLAALRSVVHDEVAREAAGRTLDEHILTDDEESRAIRDFIRRMPKGPTHEE